MTTADDTDRRTVQDLWSALNENADDLQHELPSEPADASPSSFTTDQIYAGNLLEAWRELDRRLTAKGPDALWEPLPEAWGERVPRDGRTWTMFTAEDVGLWFADGRGRVWRVDDPRQYAGVREIDRRGRALLSAMLGVVQAELVDNPDLCGQRESQYAAPCDRPVNHQGQHTPEDGGRPWPS